MERIHPTERLTRDKTEWSVWNTWTFGTKKRFDEGSQRTTSLCLARIQWTIAIWRHDMRYPPPLLRDQILSKTLCGTSTPMSQISDVISLRELDIFPSNATKKGFGIRLVEMWNDREVLFSWNVGLEFM